ncbi:MAG: hypothetical protein JO040_14410 [Gemmatimonadetes bacterium]|nr:hypothetical protein [Gemmatimonadota bacterium]
MSLSQLRPLSFAEILDGAFSIYRRHFATLFTTMLIPMLPVALLWAGFGVLAGALSAEEAETVANLFTMAMLPVSMLFNFFGTGALVWEVSQALQGGEVSRGEAYRRALRRFLPLIAATLITGLLFVLGLVFLIVPGILVLLMMFAVMQVVVIEGKGPLEALSRSRDLARGAWGHIALVVIVATIIVSLPGVLTGMLAGGITMFTILRGGNPGDVVRTTLWVTSMTNVLSTLISALTTPFFTAVVTLLYYDRRVRTEALDLEIATEELSALA